MTSSGNGYRVDVDALHATVRQLRSVADSLEQPRASARYDTVIATGMLGQGFAGADSLAATHDEMRDWLESTIGALQGLVDCYGGETASAAEAYTEQELRTRADFFSASGSGSGSRSAVGSAGAAR